MYFTMSNKRVVDPKDSRMFSVYNGVILRTEELNDSRFMTKHKQLVISTQSK